MVVSSFQQREGRRRRDLATSHQIELPVCRCNVDVTWRRAPEPAGWLVPSDIQRIQRKWKIITRDREAVARCEPQWDGWILPVGALQDGELKKPTAQRDAALHSNVLMSLMSFGAPEGTGLELMAVLLFSTNPTKVATTPTMWWSPCDTLKLLHWICTYRIKC